MKQAKRMVKFSVKEGRKGLERGREEVEETLEI